MTTADTYRQDLLAHRFFRTRPAGFWPKAIGFGVILAAALILQSQSGSIQFSGSAGDTTAFSGVAPEARSAIPTPDTQRSFLIPADAATIDRAPEVFLNVPASLPAPQDHSSRAWRPADTSAEKVVLLLREMRAGL